VSGRLHLTLLRGAAMLVRAPEREEWLAEWRAELWYVSPRRRTAFCLGAFRDAFWLWRNGPAPVYLQSPRHCLAFLATLAALSFAFSLQLSLPREMLFAPQLPAGMMTITGIPVEDFRQLPGDRSKVAFYGPATLRAGKLEVALASRNLPEVLHLPVATASDPRIAPLVVVARDRRLLGRRFTVAGQAAQVAAVISDRLWELPGHADAWLLVDDRTLATGSVGYAVAQLTPSTTHIWVHHADGSVARFICVPFAQPNLLLALLLTMAVSAMILPAVTSTSLGEYPAHHLRRWMFLAAKIAFILPIVFFGSLDLFSFIAVGLQPHSLIVGTVVGLRWALNDQRRRCPVCLRVLTNPTLIGAPSRTLLEWYGTELICTKGHGLLHVPEIPNSYSQQRWLRLDSSWSSLF